MRNFWLLEFAKYNSWLRSEAIAPIHNKIGQFLATPLIRNIIGQPKSSFDLTSISTVLEMTNDTADLGEADDKLLVAVPRHGCWDVLKP